jgi:hypothetical protein
MIEIEAPDGTVIEFPDGTADATIKSVMAKNYSATDKAPAQAEAPTPGAKPLDAVDAFMEKIGVLPMLKKTSGALEGPTRALMSGVPFSDEVVGLSASIGGGKAGYDAAVDQERQKRADYAAQNPKTATALQILGSVGSLGPNGAGAAPGLWNAIKTGGKIGGIYGAADAEGGLANRAQGAGIGAVTGAGMTAAAYPVVKAGQALFSRVGNAIQNRTSPLSAAQRKLAEALSRDNATPSRVSARLKELGPQGMLVDAAGENVTGLGRAAATIPGPAKERAGQALHGRAMGQGTRITKKINQTLSPEDFYGSQDKFLEKLRSNAGDLYPQAYKKGAQLESKKLESIFKRPVMQDAMKEAADLASIEGRRLAPIDPELTKAAKMLVSSGKISPKSIPKGGIARGISTEAVDDMKRGLDALIERETNDLTGRLTKRGAAIAGLKREMLAEVDKLNPAYAKARKVYGGDAEVLKALKDGRDALKMDPEAITRKLSGMSDAAQKSYRAGAARAIKDVVEKTGDTNNAAAKLFGNELVRKKLRALLPDITSYNNLARTLVGESRFTQSRNAILSQSKTGNILSEQADLGAVGDIASGRGVINTAVTRALNYMNNPNPKVAAELSKMLFSRNQAENMRVIDSLVSRARQAGVTTQRQSDLARALVALSSQQEGRAAGYSQRP